jgi:hypothetical protein
MFFERCGKLFFSQIRPFFLLLLVLFPPLLSALFLFFQHTQLQELEERFAAASRKGRVALSRKTQKERFLQRYASSNPYFIDQQIETLSFLQNERRHLESLLNHPALIRKEAIQQRLSFILSDENKLAFTEENIRTSSQMAEVDEKQRHPIQVDEEDLQRLLALIEDLRIGDHLPSKQSPQLLIRDFKLKKQQTALQTDVFELEMELLKREFIKS